MRPKFCQLNRKKKAHRVGWTSMPLFFFNCVAISSGSKGEKQEKDKVENIGSMVDGRDTIIGGWCFSCFAVH